MSGKENIRSRPDQQAFPIIIAEWDRNSREIVRVALASALTALSPRAALMYDHINIASSPDELDKVARTVCRNRDVGVFADDEATLLTDAIHRRRSHRTFGILAPLPFPAHANAGTYKPAGRLLSRISKFTPRPCRRRLSDEERTKRRYRKRILGGSSALPDTMRHGYTEGERAVLCIVAGEVKRHGICDLSIDEIADRAGVGRTTVQNAMHEARRLGHVEITERPQRGAKNLPNVVKIASLQWRAWIKRGLSAAQRDRVQFFKNVSTSKNVDRQDDGIARVER